MVDDHHPLDGAYRCAYIFLLSRLAMYWLGRGWMAVGRLE